MLQHTGGAKARTGSLGSVVSWAAASGKGKALLVPGCGRGLCSHLFQVSGLPLPQNPEGGSCRGKGWGRRAGGGVGEGGTPTAAAAKKEQPSVSLLLGPGSPASCPGPPASVRNHPASRDLGWGTRGCAFTQGSKPPWLWELSSHSVPRGSRFITMEQKQDSAGRAARGAAWKGAEKQQHFVWRPPGCALLPSRPCPAVLGGAGGPNSTLDPLPFARSGGGFTVFLCWMGHHWRYRLQVYGRLAGLRFPSVGSGQTG